MLPLTPIRLAETAIATVEHEEGVRAYKERIGRQAELARLRAESQARIDLWAAQEERLKKMGPLPGMPKASGPSPDLPQKTYETAPIVPPESDPGRDMAPLGSSPVLSQRDIEGDPLPTTARDGVGGPEDQQAPPVPEAPRPEAPTAPRPRPEAQRRLKPPSAGWQPAVEKPGLGETLSALFTDTRLNQNFDSDYEALEIAYDDMMRRGREVGLQFKNVGPFDANPIKAAQTRTMGSIQVPPDAFIAEWHKQLEEQLEANPELAAKMGPVTREILGGLADKISVDAHQRYVDLKSKRGDDFFSVATLAEFAVGMGAALEDPIQQETLIIGGTAKSIFGAGVREAAVNAWIEAVLQPQVQGRQLRIGNVETWQEAVASGLTNVGLATALGFTFGAGGKAVEKVITGAPPVARPEADAEFAKAREAMQTLAVVTAERDDPDGAALVRRALAEAEKDFATARQLPGGVDEDEFVRAIEAADNQVRALQAFGERPEAPVPERIARADDPPPPDVLEVARTLREKPDTDLGTIPTSASEIRTARKLARLGDETWGMVDDGRLTVEQATLVEQVAPGRPEEQALLAREIVRAAPETYREAEDVVSNALLDFADQRPRVQPAREQPSGVARMVSQQQRADIVTGATEWLSGPRSVLKPLLESGDLARSLGVPAGVTLDAQDISDLAIAALMNGRQGDTAVSRLLEDAFDSVQTQGVPARAAGQRVARQIRDLIDAEGFRALNQRQGPRVPESAETTLAFDGPGSKENIAQAEVLEGDLRPEGIEDPGVDLAKIAEPPDELATLVEEARGAGEGGGDRTPDQILADIKKLLAPPEKAEGEAGAAKAVDPVEQAEAELKRLEATEKALRDALVPLTDAQKVGLVKRQYPDAYATLNRLEGADLDDAIVSRVMAGDVKFAKRGGPGGEADITYKKFHSEALNANENKIVEMAQNNISNMDIAVELGLQVSSVRAMLGRSKKKLREAGVEIDIPVGQTGRTVEGHPPGAVRAALIEAFEAGMSSSEAFQHLGRQGIPVSIGTVYTKHSQWKSAKAKGVKFAVSPLPMDEGARLQRAKHGGYKVRAFRGLMEKHEDDLIGHEWWTANRADAETYTRGSPAGHVIEGFINPSSAVTINAGGAQFSQIPAKALPQNLRKEVKRIIDEELGAFPSLVARYKDDLVDTDLVVLAAENVGYPNVIFKNVKDDINGFAKPTTVYAISDKSARRSINAKFDPSESGSSKLLASVGDTRPLGSTREEITARVSAEFGDSAGALFRTGEVNVVDMPPAWAALNTQAITDARGRVTLFAANVNPDQVRGLMLHELGVHAGLEQMLGADGKAKVLAQLEARLAAGDDAVRAARSRVPADTNPADVIEETLAYLVQHAPRNTFVQQLFSDIRAWLYRTFPSLRDSMVLTDADLQSLAMGAVRERIAFANMPVMYGVTRAGGVFAARRPDLPMDEASQKARAREQGFDVDRVLYHGSPKSFDEFRVEKGGEGVWLTEEPFLASGYSHGFTPERLRDEGGAVYPVFARMKNPLRIDAKGFPIREAHKAVAGKLNNLRDDLAKDMSYNAWPEWLISIVRRDFSMADVIKQAKAKGHDGIIFDDVVDVGGEWNGGSFPMSRQTQHLIFDPKNIRGKFAKFDPDQTSTSGLMYARTRADGSQNPQSSGRGEVPGGARQPGRADVRGSAGAGEGAARGGDVRSGAGPARAVVAEQIPETGFVTRGWNDRVELNPGQRADRRAQFRDFVNSAEFDVEQSRGNGDFRFRNGKRTGERGAYEQLVYTLRQPEEGVHPSWEDAFGVDNTRLEVEVHGGEAIVPYSAVATALRSTGLGQKLYMRAIDDLLARGITANSDVSMSDGAIALWKSLRKQGYDVIQRVPDGMLERGPDRQLSASDDSTAIFFIARKKPRMPELPASDRDVMNSIDEARDLSEHLPKCLKGK